MVARSSAAAKYRAIANGVCELLWLQRVLAELQRPVTSPLRLYRDNKAAISIAQNPIQHDRTKHVEVDRHFIKEKIEEGQVRLVYTPTRLQLADILTKALLRV